MNALANLEDALDEGAYWLEDSACQRFARYAVAVDENGDGISTWYCTDCGLQIDDPDDGCEHCGLGAAEDMEEPMDLEDRLEQLLSVRARQ